MKTFYLILLVLFPSITFASGSSADYLFIVENTSMVNAYWNIFNALAAIFQSESYMDLLKLAFLFGGFLMLTKGVFATYEGSGSAKMISEYGKYLATVVGLLVIISGKSTVWITTNNIPTYCSTSSPTVGQTVDNIPSVLAYSFTVANTIGNGLTEIAESGFTYATESTMTKSDGYLGNLKETIKVLTIDPSKTSVTNDFDFTNMWSVFFSDCVYMPAINQGNEGAKVLADAYKSKDLLFFSETLMNYTFTQGASASPVGDSTVKYMGETYYCSAFLQTIKDLTNTHLSNFTCTLPLANSGVLELITGNVNTGATGASEMNGIARQAGLITAFKGSKAINAIGIQGADSFTGGTTKASFNMSSLSSASYMADMMPYVQMTLRAVLYAFFPFIFVVIILPGGLKVLAQYAKTLIWIELWTPTAAILHMFVSIHAQDKLSTMYSNSTGVTLMNSIDMLSETATLAGVGAMLYVSVPAITWLMITGSGQMLGNVMSGVGASFQSQLKSDQSGMELAKDLQRQKLNQKNAHNSEGRNAAITYGEMMFYENMHKGHQDAGTYDSNQNIFKQGGDISEKLKIENDSRYQEAMSKKEEQKANGTRNNELFDVNKANEMANLMGNSAFFSSVGKAKTDNTLMEMGNSVDSVAIANSKQQNADLHKNDSISNINLENAAKINSNVANKKTLSVDESDQTKAAINDFTYNTELSNSKFNNPNEIKNMAKVEAQGFINDNKIKENVQEIVGNNNIQKAQTTKQVADNESVNSVDSQKFIDNAKFSIQENVTRTDDLTNLGQTGFTSGHTKAVDENIKIETQKETAKLFNGENNMTDNLVSSQSSTAFINSSAQNEKNNQMNLDKQIEAKVNSGVQSDSKMLTSTDNMKIAFQKYGEAFKENGLKTIKQNIGDIANKEHSKAIQETNELFNQKAKEKGVTAQDLKFAEQYQAEVINQISNKKNELRESGFSQDEGKLERRAKNELTEEFMANRFNDGTRSKMDTDFSTNKFSDKQFEKMETALNIKKENEKEFNDIQNNLKHRVEEKQNNYINSLEKSGLINRTENGGYEINNGPIKDLSNIDIGAAYGNEIKYIDKDGRTVMQTMNQTGEIVSQTSNTYSGKYDSANFGMDTQRLALSAGVNENVIYASSTAMNVINSVSSVTSNRLIKQGNNGNNTKTIRNEEE